MIAAVEKRLAHIEALVDRMDAPPVQWDSPLDLAADLQLNLDPWQERVLKTTATRVIVLGPRQIGKSTVSGLLSLFVALTKPEALV